MTAYHQLWCALLKLLRFILLLSYSSYRAKGKVNKLHVFLACAALFVSGCATNNAALVDGRTRIPQLNVVQDCGQCQLKAAIPGLIQAGYRSAAAKDGIQIDTANRATLTITEYSARSNTARMLAGAFAGKDEIKSELSYQDSHETVEGYYRNAIFGIDSLAGKIGEMSYQKVLLIISNNHPSSEPK